LGENETLKEISSSKRERDNLDSDIFCISRLYHHLAQLFVQVLSTKDILNMSCGRVKSKDVVDPRSNTSLKIRFVVVNDVYTIDNYPHYASAKKIESIGPHLTIGTLAGDFLAPSLLSTIDQGVGM
jgi:hypothetical protein